MDDTIKLPCAECPVCEPSALVAQDGKVIATVQLRLLARPQPEAIVYSGSDSMGSYVVSYIQLVFECQGRLPDHRTQSYNARGRQRH